MRSRITVVNEIHTRDHELVGRLVKVGNSTKLARISGILMLGAGFKRVRVEWVNSGRRQTVNRRSIELIEEDS